MKFLTERRSGEERLDAFDFDAFAKKGLSEFEALDQIREHERRVESELRFQRQLRSQGHRAMYEGLTKAAMTNPNMRWVFGNRPGAAHVDISVGVEAELSTVVGATGGTVGVNRQFFFGQTGLVSRTYSELPRGGAGFGVSVGLGANLAVKPGSYEEFMVMNFQEIGPQSVGGSDEWEGVFHNANAGVGIANVGAFWSAPGGWFGLSAGVGLSTTPLTCTLTDIDYKEIK